MKSLFKAFFAASINVTLLASLFCLQVGQSYAGSGSSNLPKGYFKMVPGPLNSKSAFSVVHDSGELVVLNNTKLSKKGKLRKTKSFTVVHQNSDAYVEFRFKSGGQKVQVKTSDKTKLTLTINPTTNEIKTKLKSKRVDGSSVKQQNDDNLDNHGAYWWQTVDIIEQLAAKVNDASETEGPLDPYGELNPAAASLGALTSGSVNLGQTQGAAIATALWAGTKAIAITMGTVATIMGLAGLITGGGVVAGVGALIGIAGVSKAFWDLAKFQDPSLEQDTADEVFEYIGVGTDGFDAGKLLAELMEKGAKALKSSTIALEILDFFSEQERHKVARGLVLKVLYTWPASQSDLDTATTFLGDTVGYSCGDSSTYMVWTGDDTGTGGLEQVTVLISDAASNNALPTNFDIDAKAGWFAPAGGSGPASLEMYLENPMSGALYGERVSKTIAPGSQSGCATTPVGGGNFTWNPTTNELGWNLF